MNAEPFNSQSVTSEPSLGKRLIKLCGAAVLVALFVIGSAVPGARPAHACSCGYDPSSLGSFLNNRNTTAFIGRATSVSAPTPEGKVTYTFAVDRSLKGYGGPTISIETVSNSASCGVSYPLNVSMGVALAGTGKDKFSVSLCDTSVSSTNVAAFETFASGALPAPTGSGAIAGFGLIGSDIGAVFDDQLRVLGYVAGVGDRVDACPGGRYLFGLYVVRVDSSQNPIFGAYRIDLSTLAMTRFANAGLDSVYCLDTEGTLVLSGGPTPEAPKEAFVKTIARSGERRTIPAVPGYTSFEGVVDQSLVWSTATEVVVTNVDGTIVRRLPYNVSGGYSPGPDVLDGYLFVESADRATFNVTSLATGATTTVDSPYSSWVFGQSRLYRLSNPTTLDVIDLPSGARSQMAITSGPNDPNWKLTASYPRRTLLLKFDTGNGTRPDAPNFYTISSTGAATSYQMAPSAAGASIDDWRSGTFTTSVQDAEVWMLSTAGPQRVLNGFFGSWVTPLSSGITPVAGACGRTSIPTTNYQCTLDPPVERLPDTL